MGQSVSEQQKDYTVLNSIFCTYFSQYLLHSLCCALLSVGYTLTSLSKQVLANTFISNSHHVHIQRFSTSPLRFTLRLDVSKDISVFKEKSEHT